MDSETKERNERNKKSHMRFCCSVFPLLIIIYIGTAAAPSLSTVIAIYLHHAFKNETETLVFVID